MDQHNDWRRYGVAAKRGTTEITHWIWTRWVHNKDQIFHITQAEHAPGAGAGGYFNVNAALSNKGLAEVKL